MMAVFPGGGITGTIGGGNVEFECQRLAAELLERGGDALRQFRFTLGDAASLGMVCGGGVTVQFQYLPRGRAEDHRRFAGSDRGGRRKPGHLAPAADRGGAGDGHGPGRPDRAPSSGYPAGGAGAPVRESGGLCPEVGCPSPVVKARGGPISSAADMCLRPWCRCWRSLGFRPVVYDDRPEFADPALFPKAEKTLCGDFARLSEQVTVTPEDYVVVMTRGHQADYEVLTQVLRSGAKYLGCIGSKRKLALCRERLLAAGFTDEEYARLHAPIGLAIGAQTPEEIAVSVAAEMIAVRAGLENGLRRPLG